MSMSPGAARGSFENPFSTRFVRPGALAYVFEPPLDAASLVRRLEQSSWQAQIIGPHGSGKSTLLAALAAPLAEAGRTPVLFGLRGGERRLPRDWFVQARSVLAPIVVIDGYEQLARWSRFWVRRCCRRHGWGLLVTAHADVGLPTLVQTSGSLPLVETLVRELMPPGAVPIEPAVIADCYRAAAGNVRETLFALFDYYQSRAAE